MILYNPTVSGSLVVTGSLTTTGTITSQTLVVQTITSSIEFNTGSTRNGTLSTNTHEFTGSVSITGSAAALLSVNNSVLYVSASGNVGIGTITPSTKLHVYEPLTNTSAYLTIQNNRARNAAVLTQTSNGGFYAGTSIGTDTFNYQIYDAVAGEARLTISSTGAATFQSVNAKTNTGNWHQTIFDTSTMATGVGGGISFCGNKATSTLGLFAAIDGFKENATSANELGGFRIWTSNGTNLVERMRITSGGNIGIGLTGPRSILEVQKTSGNTSLGVASGFNLLLSQGGAINEYSQIGLGYTNANSPGVIGFLTTDAAAYTSGALIFATRNATTDTVPSERMRISSNGNVGIGTTGSGRTLSVYTNTVTQALFVHNQRNISGDYALTMQLGGNTNHASSYYMFCDTDAVGVRMVVYGNGNVANVNNSYGAYSDIKLKENITDATPKLEDLLKVKIRNYNLKTDPSLKQIGIIAQELEEIFPGLIEESNDTIKDEETGELTNTGTTTKSIKYSVFIPMLIKAIQELSAKNTALEEILQRNNIQ